MTNLCSGQCVSGSGSKLSTFDEGVRSCAARSRAHLGKYGEASSAASSRSSGLLTDQFLIRRDWLYALPTTRASLARLRGEGAGLSPNIHNRRKTPSNAGRASGINLSLTLMPAPEPGMQGKFRPPETADSEHGAGNV